MRSVLKPSRFNVVEKLGDGVIVYNSLSAGVLRLNPEYAASFESLAQTGTCDREDLVRELMRGNMAVPDSVDEVGMLKVHHMAQRYDTSTLSLTIAPTLECNFACTYCYEEGVRHSTMTPEVEDAVVRFIQSRLPGARALGIAWYGGEPLLAIDIIDRLTRRIKDLLGGDVKYGASMVTNGYFLTRDMARRLRSLDIDRIQVTVDGPPHAHDRRRMLRGGQGTFERIMRNLTEACEEIRIVVRVNVDRGNVEVLDELLDQFESWNLKGKVDFYLAPVDDINDSCGLLASTCLSMAEFSRESLALYERAMQRGFSTVLVPPANLGVCGAVSLGSYVIDPRGDLYKCWDQVGRKSECVGNVFTGPEYGPNLVQWLLYDPLADGSCADCPVLPACFGGCPYQKIKGGAHRCAPIRYNAPETLRVLNRARSR